MPNTARLFESAAFGEAHDKAKREQSEFRSMLQNYRSPPKAAEGAAAKPKAKAAAPARKKSS